MLFNEFCHSSAVDGYCLEKTKETLSLSVFPNYQALLLKIKVQANSYSEIISGRLCGIEYNMTKALDQSCVYRSVKEPVPDLWSWRGHTPSSWKQCGSQNAAFIPAVILKKHPGK